jgi:hypothetical protein
VKGKLLLSLLLAAGPLMAHADQLVPAGSVISCTIAEPKVSSKTQNIGDPILCQLSHVEMYGRSTFPYGSYLVGQFAEYKDPGHFVGKGWMELKFDRLVVQPDTVVPINVRVVATPKYPVDKEGRIHGTGHPVRDAIEWSIPLLWPIDLINLPRRGPRPVLAAETRLTLKVLDDFGIPTPQENAVRTPALISRQTPDEPTYQSYRQPEPQYQQPVQQPYYPPQQQYAPPMQQSYAPPPQPAYSYAQPAQSPTVIVVQAPQPVYMQAPAPTVVVQQGPTYPPPPPPVVVGPYGYGPARFAVPYRPRYWAPY